MAYTIKVNGTSYTVDVPGETPLLWVLRDVLGLTGTKYGCGIEVCNACNVWIDGSPEKSCHIPVKEVTQVNVTTIEGLSADGQSHPLQKAWIAEQVPQCGYCQSGMIMRAAAMVRGGKKPSDASIDAMPNICVCGTYNRIKKAIKRVANGEFGSATATTTAATTTTTTTTTEGGRDRKGKKNKIKSTKPSNKKEED